MPGRLYFPRRAHRRPVGSPDARSKPKHLEEIRAVLDVMEADEFSDHLAYSTVDGERFHDFAPLWRVEEQVAMLCTTG